MPESISTSVDLSGEDVHWSPEGGLSYGAYLKLDGVLKAQQPMTTEHDEMMFIIIHQASELWLKLCLHELDAAIECIIAGEFGPASKMLSRIARIQEQLTQSWSILATMTPADYLKFRDKLGQSSGFQSYQYRMLEYRLGNKNAAMARVHGKSQQADAVREYLNKPSIYDEALRQLAKAGFDIPADRLDRDWSQPYKPSPAVETAWKEVYSNIEEHWQLYEMAEKLVDVEHKFQLWRFNHMKTVERIIGYRRGTGGTGGVSYLVKALELRFFPELWTVRTSL
ncbi:tryptophan 2,3-dioxygenase [Hyphobacterium sp. CCMP332]|uniref:tryptophan 2,3-dioxygenase n=1 Tax=Hyphobacterium sp. CCMP332 TaxID=2749086 RepID=UPI00165082D0|nr:tryptophan 2,3-dioxygenase family protein [Hyphobacterium sp. CCMP332]QNL18729.1 tryptophan 2,3-dioxygenase [Hyphobacterium sp. CCMP332]